MPNGITREELIAWVAANHGAAMAMKVQRVMGGFTSIQAFVSADKSALLAAYRKVRPDVKNDLGQTFYATFSAVEAWYRGESARRRKEAEEAKRREAEAAQREAQENPRFTADQIRALSSLMDLCGIAEIDLKGIMEVFSKMKVRVEGVKK
jgi:hypothetical protein